MSHSPDFKHRASKLARQVLGVLESRSTDYEREQLIEEVKKEVGKRYCLLCFRKYEHTGDRCYCDPIYDE